MREPTLRRIIREELALALNRTITVEKGPEKPGDPEKRIETQEINVLDFMAQYLPQIEGRLLGAQADINKVTAAAETQGAQLRAIGGALLSMERAARSVGELSDTIRGWEIKQIGGGDAGDS
jgi:hypothetical protein